MSPSWIAWTATVLLTVAAPPLGANAAQTIHLIDQRGVSFTLEDLRGTPVVLTFVSAHCSDACPLLDAEVAQSVERVKHGSRFVRFLTVTLDPERDTARDMQRIAAQFDANPMRWVVATGSVRDVHALMRIFNVRIERDATGYASAHTTYIYLLDSRMHLQRTLLPSTDLAEELVEGGIIQ